MQNGAMPAIARPKLVVIGNGMAGMRTVEELLRIAPDIYRITVFGAEPHPNYNRILLSPVLAASRRSNKSLSIRTTGISKTTSSCTPASAWFESTARAAGSRPPTEPSHTTIACCLLPVPIR